MVYSTQYGLLGWSEMLAVLCCMTIHQLLYVSSPPGQGQAQMYL